MTREEANGPRKVARGRIVQTGIKDITEAVQIKKRFVQMDDNFSYEITGVYGDYKIIKRELESTNSEYVS